MHIFVVIILWHNLEHTLAQVSCKEGCVDVPSSIFIVLAMRCASRDREEKVLATNIFFNLLGEIDMQISV